PANPGFYHRPHTAQQLVDFVVARILDQIGVEHGLMPRWGEPSTSDGCAKYSRWASEMSVLPIFPLNTVLFPGALLPLKIFEQRYVDMTKACVRDHSDFGVCRIREGREVGLPAVPEHIGCSAQIMDWEMPPLGVFHLRTP